MCIVILYTFWGGAAKTLPTPLSCMYLSQSMRIYFQVTLREVSSVIFGVNQHRENLMS